MLQVTACRSLLACLLKTGHTGDQVSAPDAASDSLQIAVGLPFEDW